MHVVQNIHVDINNSPSIIPLSICWTIIASKNACDREKPKLLFISIAVIFEKFPVKKKLKKDLI